MTFYIEKIKIDLTEDQYGLQLKALDEKLPLPSQTIEETKAIVTKNFDLVKEKFYETSATIIAIEDLNEVCLRIVLHYFYLYNTWKNIYEKEKNRDLTFLDKDFSHPNTYDKIIQFFKNKYPKDYAPKCAVMLGIKATELLKYEADKQDFYNSFR
jgi:hypothetical protein